MIALKTTLLSFFSILLFLQPILAVRGDACGEFACGSVTWKWDTKYVLCSWHFHC